MEGPLDQLIKQGVNRDPGSFPDPPVRLATLQGPLFQVEMIVLVGCGETEVPLARILT